MMKRIATTACLTLVPFLAAASAPLDGQKAAQANAKALGQPQDVTVGQQLPFYPLDTCIVSGEDLVAGETEDVVYEGRLLRLCCGRCKKGVEKDPEAVLAKLDAAAVRAQKPYYPMQECLVSDEALGSMGDPIELVHDGRLARLCCKGCVKSFKKDPAKYFATIDRAMIADQKKEYSATTCPVSDEPLGDKAVDHLYGYRLVRTCCKKCAAAVDKNPEKYVAKVAVKRGGGKVQKGASKGH